MKCMNPPCGAEFERKRLNSTAMYCPACRRQFQQPLITRGSNRANVKCLYDFAPTVRF